MDTSTTTRANPANGAAAPQGAAWQELLSQLGRELAEPLTAALDRVTTLTTTGRIDRAGLRALRDEVERARQAGIWSQQIARLASGGIRQMPEHVDLTGTLQSVLAHRALELQAKCIGVTQHVSTQAVQADASMLYSLLNALLDWVLDTARGTVHLRLETGTWPDSALLHCQFEHQAADAPTAPSDEAHARINTVRWHLLDQTARAMGTTLRREITPSGVHVQLSFTGGPDKVNDKLVLHLDNAELDAPHASLLPPE
jgi:hypothetical protein